MLCKIWLTGILSIFILSVKILPAWYECQNHYFVIKILNLFLRNWNETYLVRTSYGYTPKSIYIVSKILVMYWNAFINIPFFLTWAIFFQLETETPTHTPSNSKPITQDGIVEAFTIYTQSLAPKDTKLTGTKLLILVLECFNCWFSYS